jgi:hypothetical protein
VGIIAGYTCIARNNVILMNKKLHEEVLVTRKTRRVHNLYVLFLSQIVYYSLKSELSI